MADEAELSRFREKWKEEVTVRTQGQARAGSSSAATNTTRPPSHGPQRLRLPSFSHARPPAAYSIEGEGEDFTDELPSTHSATSPPPLYARRASHSLSGAPKSALEHYEKAVEKETEGNLGESLKLYRKAFRMDDAVDKSYREKHFPRPQVPAGGTIPEAFKGKVVAPSAHETGVRTAHHSPAPTGIAPTGVSDLIASFAGFAIEPTTKPSLAPVDGTGDEADEDEKKFSLLAAVPSELLLQILHYLALADIAAYARLAQVCKSLSYIVATEDKIWRDVCKLTFPEQVWDWKVSVSGHPLIDEVLFPEPVIVEEGELDDEAEDEEEEEKRLVPINEEEVLRYGNNWREMYHLRPRLRYNGIYISICNYHRPGGHLGTGLSWGTPVHIVTYYRYLRFYPDGTLLSLLTTHEPSEVVYAFSKLSLTPAHLGGLSVGSSTLSSWGSHVSQGRWRIDREGRVDVETEAQNLPRYLFRMQFRVKNVRAGRNTVRGAVKLVWEGFWSWNKLTDDLAVFEGRNDKPFFFSRVGAVEKELANVQV